MIVLVVMWTLNISRNSSLIGLGYPEIPSFLYICIRTSHLIIYTTMNDPYVCWIYYTFVPQCHYCCFKYKFGYITNLSLIWKGFKYYSTRCKSSLSSELLGSWTSFIVRYSINLKTQRFGNLICFHHQVRSEDTYSGGSLRKSEPQSLDV
jgi:hypothetical protein